MIIIRNFSTVGNIKKGLSKLKDSIGEGLVKVGTKISSKSHDIGSNVGDAFLVGSLPVRSCMRVNVPLSGDVLAGGSAIVEGGGALASKLGKILSNSDKFPKASELGKFLQDKGRDVSKSASKWRKTAADNQLVKEILDDYDTVFFEKGPRMVSDATEFVTDSLGKNISSLGKKIKKNKKK